MLTELSASALELPAMPRRQYYWAHLNLLTQNIIQRSSQMGESLDKALIVSQQPTKCANLSKRLWHWKILDGTHVVSAGVDSLLGHAMCQVHDF